MILQNVMIGKNVSIHESSSINNIVIGNNVRIAKRCSLFGSDINLLVIGSDSYIGMNSIINGFSSPVIIGEYCSIAQNVNIMTDSGPNASDIMQKVFPIKKGNVSIGDHSWIGAGVTIMPNVEIGKYCVVAANSFVNSSFCDFSIIGGTPAKLIRKMTLDEVDKIKEG